MRPTRRGLAVLAATPALLVAGWLLGQPELTVAGVVAATLLALGAVAAWVPGMRLEVHRTARPSRLTADDPCRIHLRVRNVGRRHSPVLTLRDDVGRFGRASLELAPVPPGATRDATYAFPTDQRGVHPVGPLEAVVEDPFGLVRTRRVLPGRTAVVVLPRTWPLAPLPPARGEEREGGARALATGSTVDEELAALRPYEPGDDVRRIHWRTTARTGEPVVRQFDEPWQRRTTVLLDDRPSAHDAPSFERAVSVAASVVVLGASRGELLRLVTASGADTGFVSAAGHRDALLDRLAGAATDPRGSLTAAVARLGGRSTPGRLVTCTGTLAAEEARGLANATRQAGVHVLVCTGAPPAGPGDRASLGRGPVVLSWTDTGGDLGVAWAEALSGAAAGLGPDRAAGPAADPRSAVPSGRAGA